MKNKNLIKWTLLWLGVVWVMFASTTNAEAVITEAMDGSIGTITVCNESYSDDCITIMDRNLWATTNDITSTWSYGNHYQWWNNYWFSPWSSVTTSNAQVACNNPFSSSTWIIGYNEYCITWNNNLWWWSGDLNPDFNPYDPSTRYNTSPVTNASERQWPCPNGYHVPSMSEWRGLVSIWAGRSTSALVCEAYWWDDDVAQFQNDFKIPFAGERDGYSAVLNTGNYAGLWSSTPEFQYEANSFTVFDNKVADHDRGDRADGLSVRCFRNEPILPPPSIDVLVTIEWWTLTIWIDTWVITNWALNLWTLKISNSVQTKTWEFGANSFRVDDQKWVESGYYTTLSVTDLVWENPAHVIWAENVQLKSASSSVSLISWTPVNESYVWFSNSIQNWVTATWNITYFNRQNTATANAGRLWKYGDNLQIKVNIPAHTLPDTYRGTITYTLYDLDE